MGLLFKNNAETTLSSGINNSTTTVPVASAAVFPTPDANNVFFATIEEGNNIEVVKVTGISSNDLTVVRAQDNTSAAAFGSGSKIELRLTAQVLDMGTASITDLDGDTKIQVEETADDDNIRFDTAGSERMKIDSTGDVAIGSRGTNPMGLSMVGTVLALTEQTNVASFQMDGNQAARIDMGSGPGTRQFVIYTDTSNYSSLERKDQKPILFATNNTERFRIDASGNVGVGTSSPSHTLTVNSGSTAVSAKLITTGATGYLQLDNSGGSSGILSDGDDLAIFTTSSGTERLRIGDNGFIKLPSKVAFSGTGDAGLGHHTNNYMYIYGGTAGLILQDNSGGSNRVLLRDTNTIEFETNGSARMSLDSTGNLVVSGNVTAYGSPSDIRLKENVEVIDNAVDKVKQLKGITYDLKSDGNRLTGLIAQDLEKVLPEAVYTAKDLETEEEHLAIRYGNTVGLLVEAIKEQQEQIEVLTAKVKELEAK